jgi:hypothetical protein
MSDTEWIERLRERVRQLEAEQLRLLARIAQLEEADPLDVFKGKP